MFFLINSTNFPKIYFNVTLNEIQTLLFQIVISNFLFCSIHANIKRHFFRSRRNQQLKHITHFLPFTRLLKGKAQLNTDN